MLGIFYPYGIVLQAIAIVHFIRRRPDAYWLWIILLGGGLGSLVYIVVEMVPDARLLHGAFQVFPRRKRIKQLEAAGLIQGYAAIVDPKRAGQAIQAIVQIKLAQHSDEIVERFRRTLIDRPEVLACYTMTGEMDFLLHVIVRDIDALADFTMRRLLRVAGVRDVTSSIVLETVKRSSVIPLEELAPD